MTKLVHQFKTVKEVVDLIISTFSEDILEKLKNVKYTDFNSFHFDLGLYIRNNFIYNANESFKDDLSKEHLGHYGEHGEVIIIEALWRKLNNKELPESTRKQVADLRNEMRRIHSQSSEINEEYINLMIDYQAILLGIHKEDSLYSRYKELILKYVFFDKGKDEKERKRIYSEILLIEAGFSTDEQLEFLTLFDVYYENKDADKDTILYKKFKNYRIQMISPLTYRNLK